MRYFEFWHSVLIVLSVCLSVAIFIVSQGHIVYALLPLLLPLAASFFLLTFKFKVEHFILLFVFIAFILDTNSFAFNDAEPFTEILGANFFYKSLPFLPLNVFELTSYAFLFYVVIVERRLRFIKKEYFEVFGILLVVVGGFCLLAYFSGFTGIMRGGNIRYLIYQTRFFPLFFAWVGIGFLVFNRVELVFKFLLTISVAMFFKALQGYYVYYVAYNGSMGVREFLIEHLTSDYIATMWFFVVPLAFWHFKGLFSKLLCFAYALFLFPPYYWNDRRTSLVGVVASFFLCVSLLPKRVFLFYWRQALLVVVGVSLMLGASWVMSEHPLIGYPARTIQDTWASLFERSTGVRSIEEIDYRTVENFAMFTALSNSPFWGVGFGRNVPFPFETYATRSTYELYDVLLHNNLLFIWTFMGPLGISFLGLILVLMMYSSAQLLRQWDNVALRIVGIVALTCTVRWAFYILGDMGLFDQRDLCINGLLLGFVFKEQYRLNSKTLEP